MILGDVTVTLTDLGKAAILNQAIVSPGAVGQLHGATCDVFVAAITPTGSTQLGDLTLPAWVGYSAQTITWIAAAVVSVGLAEMDGSSVEFTLPSAAISQTLYGWAVSDTTPRLVAVGLLTAPILINDAGTAVVVPYIPWLAPA